MLLNSGAAAASAPADDLVKETTTQGFVADVIEASKQQPVLVDFWAPWCGPCRQLTPVIEKVIRAAKGKAKLVKMNIDEHPAIPGQMGIQLIPAVIGFVDGQPVDGFMGALPESQVTAFVERLIKDRVGGEGQDLLAAADAALADGDAAEAAEIYAQLLAEEPDNVAALAGMVLCYVETKALEQARQTLAMVPEAKQGDPAVAAARAALDPRRAGGVARADHRTGAEGGGRSARPPVALRPSGGAQRQGPAPGRAGAPDRDRAARPHLERGRGPQAIGATFRGLGPARRGDRGGTPAALVDPVRLTVRFAAGFARRHRLRPRV